jgi:hypothetical protein
LEVLDFNKNQQAIVIYAVLSSAHYIQNRKPAPYCILLISFSSRNLSRLRAAENKAIGKWLEDRLNHKLPA